MLIYQYMCTYKFTHESSADGDGWYPWDAVGDSHGHIQNFVTVQMSLWFLSFLPGFVLYDSITQGLSIFHDNLQSEKKNYFFENFLGYYTIDNSGKIPHASQPL